MIRICSKIIDHKGLHGRAISWGRVMPTPQGFSLRHPWRSVTAAATTAGETNSTTTSNQEMAEASQDGEAEKPLSRNKALAEIIRGGFRTLSQAASAIQSNPITRKSLFAPPEDLPSPRQKSDEHLIHTTAREFLEGLAKKDGKLCVHGDPIVILNVELKDSKLAVLHWALPFSVLADETISNQEKQLLEFRMHKILVDGGGTQLLQRGVHAALRHYYPPRLRLEPAPDRILLEALNDIL
eukprot:scaffold37600_cov176-Amphora_coffeaeformis.AAC.3